MLERRVARLAAPSLVLAVNIACSTSRSSSSNGDSGIEAGAHDAADDQGATDGSDAGGATGDAGAETVGEQCTAIDTEFCDQAINRCALSGFTLAECIANNMAACCSGSACSAVSKYTQGAVDACKADIDVEDCNAIVNSMTPQSCQALLHQ